MNPLRKGGRKIMIVDDDETILHVLRRFFAGRGFQVLTARDGTGAMECLEAETPELVLTDLKMPSLSGKDLIALIREKRKDTPIIVMTAYPHLYPENKSRNELSAYFVKPFDADEMLSTVQRILGD
jgi:DNA-binding response OmpR family regulator